VQPRAPCAIQQGSEVYHVSKARLALALAGALIVACGGSSSGGGDSCTPGSSATITITATGMSPQNACIQPGGSVTFTNSDTTQHDIEFQGSGCPTSPGGIQAGASKSTVFPTSQNCGYSDNTKAGVAAFTGTIAVSTQTQTGGGY
jgi:plastocyanin